jgi:general stress protein CsbA
MLFRILGEVVVGILVAGVVTAVVVPVTMQLGYTAGPWLVIATACASIAACVVGGERVHARRKARESP